MEHDIIVVVVSGVITGLISAVGTVKALSIHIQYLKDGLQRVETLSTSAHKRINSLINRSKTERKSDA